MPKVKCINNNEIFNSFSEAARFFNLAKGSVSRSVNFGVKVKGLKFEVENFIPTKEIPRIKYEYTACLVCEQRVKSANSLGNHLRFKHKDLTPEKYFRKFIHNKTCYCGNETKFITLGVGIRKHCSLSCATKDIEVFNKLKETNKKRYNSECTLQSIEGKKEVKRVYKEKYDGHPMQNKDIFQKCLKSSYKTKLIEVDGKMFHVQGNENKFLLNCESLLNISASRLTNKIDPIKYEYNNGIHSYFPDFKIEDENVLIEIKSIWTWDRKRK